MEPQKITAMKKNLAEVNTENLKSSEVNLLAQNISDDSSSESYLYRTHLLLLLLSLLLLIIWYDGGCVGGMYVNAVLDLSSSLNKGGLTVTILSFFFFLI